MCFAPQRRALFRHLDVQKWSEHGVLCTFWPGNVLRATTPCTFSTSQLPKVVRAWCVLWILTWRCASCHNGVHFFDIWTSKSGPSMVCFVHFDLDMCFAPQRRALFRHLNFQQCVLYIFTWKCASRQNGVHFFDISTSKSGPSMVCFVHFDLEMCFAPQRRALFRHLKFQKSKVVWEWCALCILTWKCALRHNGVQFFISHLIWPDGSAPAALASRQIIPTFSRTRIFFLITLSLLCSSHFLASPLWLFPPLLFHLSILSEVWLLNFLRLHPWGFPKIWVSLNHPFSRDFPL